MSLYDGLDMDEKEAKKDKPDVSGWGSGQKLLENQKQLQAKKASLLNVKKRQNNSVAPVFDLNKRTEDNQLTFNMLTGKVERRKDLPSTPTPPTTAAPTSLSPFIGAEAPSTFLGVTDEYDPRKPNDYESYVKLRKEQRQKEREEERQKEMEEREKKRRERHRDSNQNDSEEEEEEEERRRRRRSRREEEDQMMIRDRQEDEEDHRRRSEPRTPGRGAAIAPPQSLMEESKPEPPSPQAAGNGQLPAHQGEYGSGFNVGKGSVVSRMMAKMGYRKGQGLGKSEQGMSTALQVEKTSKRGGKIIHERDIPQAPPEAAKIPEISNVNLLRNPSKVVLLRNMVGPGEVDEELEPETAEECEKYGKVTRCVIFEIPTNPDDDAVRIFVEFDRQESAIKAIVDLNGRYFGGRMVKATFYNLDKFRRLDLGGPVD